MSEALTQLAVATKDPSWVSLAKRFERPCFVGPLALVGRLEQARRGGDREDAREHAPARDPRCRRPLRGDGRARGRTRGDELLRRTQRVAYFRDGRIDERRDVAGRSPARRPRRAAARRELLEPRPPRDVRESQLRCAPRARSWRGAPAPTRAARRRSSSLDRRGVERTLLNAVLGTQRGTTPGSMLYMLPMGSGVSKAGISNAPQGHHWSDGEHHFWCCQGSGIEAFARIHDSVFWRLSPAFAARGGGGAEPSSSCSTCRAGVVWSLGVCLTPDAQQCFAKRRRAAHDDADGDGARRRPGRRPRPPLLRMAAAAVVGRGPRAGAYHESLRVLSRDDGAQPVLLPAAGGHGGGRSARSRRASPRGFAPMGAGEGHPRWYPLLHAALHGNLLLAGLTYGERALHAGTKLLPVPRSAAKELGNAPAAARPSPPRCQGAGRRLLHGLSRQEWENVWVVWTEDKRRSFVNLRSLSAPAAAACKRRATAAERRALSMGEARRRRRPVVRPRSRRAATRALDGRVDGKSPFASGTLVLMHNGSARGGGACRAAADGARATDGGMDAANAATWRLTSSRARHGGGGGDGEPPHVSRGLRLTRQRADRHPWRSPLEVAEVGGAGRSGGRAAVARAPPRRRRHYVSEAAAPGRHDRSSRCDHPGRRGGAAPRAPRALRDAGGRSARAAARRPRRSVFPRDPPPSIRRRAMGAVGGGARSFKGQRWPRLSTSRIRSTSAWATGYAAGRQRRAAVLRVYIRFESSRFGVSPSDSTESDALRSTDAVSPNSPSSHATCRSRKRGAAWRRATRTPRANARLIPRGAVANVEQIGDTSSRRVHDRRRLGGGAAGVAGTSTSEKSRPWHGRRRQRAGKQRRVFVVVEAAEGRRQPPRHWTPRQRGDAVGAAAGEARAPPAPRPRRRRRRRRRPPPQGASSA